MHTDKVPMGEALMEAMRTVRKQELSEPNAHPKDPKAARYNKPQPSNARGALTGTERYEWPSFGEAFAENERQPPITYNAYGVPAGPPPPTPTWYGPTTWEEGYGSRLAEISSSGEEESKAETALDEKWRSSYHDESQPLPKVEPPKLRKQQ